MTYAGRVRAPLLVLSLFACSCERLYSDPISVPSAESAISVPLDVAWEMRLEIYSGSSPAPMGVHGVTATCSPAARCVTRVEEPFVENDAPKLVVVGLAPGPVDVQIRYVHPIRKETMTAPIHLAFFDEKPPEVDGGDELHGSAFVWKHAPASMVNHLASGGPAGGASAPDSTSRCEGRTYKEGRNRYTCFVLEESAPGQMRYASCEASTRCSILPGGVLVDGYDLCVERDGAGHVTGAVATGKTERLATWGVVTPDGCAQIK